MPENPYQSPFENVADDESGAPSAAPRQRSLIVCAAAGGLVGTGPGSAAAAIVWTALAVAYLAAHPPDDLHEASVQLSMGFVAAAIVGTGVGLVVGGMAGVLTAIVCRALDPRSSTSKVGVAASIFSLAFAFSFGALVFLMLASAWLEVLLVGGAGAVAGGLAGRLFARRLL